jgi:hypothetical protein
MNAVQPAAERMSIDFAVAAQADEFVAAFAQLDVDPMRVPISVRARISRMVPWSVRIGRSYVRRFAASAVSALFDT